MPKSDVTDALAQILNGRTPALPVARAIVEALLRPVVLEFRQLGISRTLRWSAAVPRIGETIHFEEPATNQRTFGGEVTSVIWTGPASAQIMVRP